MNLLILNWKDTKNPSMGGAERVTLEHAKGWIKAGHQVTWFTSSFPGAMEEEYYNGIRFIRKGNHVSVYLWAPFFWYRNKQEFDIIIDQVHGIPFFTPIYVNNTKIIVLIHEIAGIIWDIMYPFPVNFIGRFLEKIYLNIYRNKNFWTDAYVTRRELATHGVKDYNITVIPCALDNPPTPKYPKEQNPTFIFVGRIVKMKGIEDVILSFRIVRTSISGSKLWVVGTGDEKYVNKIKFMVEKLKISDSVIFFGQVKERRKFELMNRAHILLHASVKEGWGLVVMEAASQGTPSVVYPNGSLSEIVIQHKTGIIVSSGKPEFLAKEAINLYLNQKKYSFVRSACIKNVRKYSWDNSIKQSLLMLNNTINE